MSNHADYTIVQIDKDRIFIIDLDLGNRSVTNDAEYVLGILQAHYPGKRVIYRDTMGTWDEITGNSLAAGFKAYKEYLPEVLI